MIRWRDFSGADWDELPEDPPDVEREEVIAERTAGGLLLRSRENSDAYVLVDDAVELEDADDG